MLADKGRRVSVLPRPVGHCTGQSAPRVASCVRNRLKCAQPSLSRRRCGFVAPSCRRNFVHCTALSSWTGRRWVAVGLFRLTDSSSRCHERQRNYFRNQFHRTPAQKAQSAASTLNSNSAKHRVLPSPVIAPARRFSKICSGRTNSDALNLLPHRYPTTILCIVAQPPIVQAAIPVKRLACDVVEVAARAEAR